LLVDLLERFGDDTPNINKPGARRCRSESDCGIGRMSRGGDAVASACAIPSGVGRNRADDAAPTIQSQQ